MLQFFDDPVLEEIKTKAKTDSSEEEVLRVVLFWRCWDVETNTGPVIG